MKKKNLLMTAIAIFGLATITIAQLPSYVPTNGLVGWWPFNGNANDESGNGNNGTVNGATLTTDRFGNASSAYDFDGVNDWIEVAHNSNINFDITDEYSISVWTMISSSNINVGQIGEIICKWDNSYEQYPYKLMSTTSASGFNLEASRYSGGIPQNNSNVHSFASDELQFDLFYNVALIYSPSSGIDIYINGIYNGTSNLDNLTSVASTYNLFFGRRGASSTRHFKGVIDDIGIWNRALTQQEITDLYNGCQLSVNTQPINQTINANNNAQFMVGSSDPNATYQWQTDLGVGFQNLNNVGQYNGTTTNTLTVSNVTMSNNNQPFRCIVSSGSCSDTSNVAVLTVNSNVGINETTVDNLFTVFPNPAQNIINVKVDSKLIGQVYSIYDNTGKVVLTGKLNSQNTTIELNNLSGGVYMLSVGDNMNQSFKVIKE